MARRSRKTGSEGMAIATELMLAPLVMWLRVPIMALEPRPSGQAGVETLRAISEKTAAMAEGVMAAQMSVMESAASFWPEVMAGRTPTALNGVGAERALNAAFKPAGKTVKANYRRLSSKR